jgi:hypothetical protein
MGNSEHESQHGAPHATARHTLVIQSPIFAGVWRPLSQEAKGCPVRSPLLFAAVVAASMAAPLAAQAQGVPGGFAHGASEGYRIAGPVGAVVGAPVGGVIGGIEGLLGVRPAYLEPPPRVVQRRTVRVSSKKPRRARVVQ